MFSISALKRFLLCFDPVCVIESLSLYIILLPINNGTVFPWILFSVMKDLLSCDGPGTHCRFLSFLACPWLFQALMNTMTLNRGWSYLDTLS